MKHPFHWKFSLNQPQPGKANKFNRYRKLMYMCMISVIIHLEIFRDRKVLQ